MLDQPSFDTFVLLYDGSDLWGIDRDGDLLYWDVETAPGFPHEIRAMSTHIPNLGDCDDETINRAFRESVPCLEFSWAGWCKQRPVVEPVRKPPMEDLLDVLRRRLVMHEERARSSLTAKDRSTYQCYAWELREIIAKFVEPRI